MHVCDKRILKYHCFNSWFCSDCVGNFPYTLSPILVSGNVFNLKLHGCWLVCQHAIEFSHTVNYCSCKHSKKYILFFSVPHPFVFIFFPPHKTTLWCLGFPNKRNSSISFKIVLSIYFFLELKMTFCPRTEVMVSSALRCTGSYFCCWQKLVTSGQMDPK